MHRQFSAPEIADILHAGMDAYIKKYGFPSKEHFTIVNALHVCRTSALGGHVERCGHCGYEEISYNSCRNRHCPKCQGKAAKEWTKKRSDDLLPVPYFHVVFTIPQEFNPVAVRNRKPFYDLMFKAVSGTLLELAKNKNRLGAEIGFFAVLHTWGQNLMEHPHIHCVIPNGGLSKNREQWKKGKSNYFLPVKVLSALFRGKFLAFFQDAVQTGTVRFYGNTSYLERESEYRAFLAGLYQKDWIVYAKQPFAGPEQVIQYLSRYTHKIAISNRRIVGMENGTVSFLWRDYRDQNKMKTMTLDIVEFIRRFLLHFLPKGFVRIRYFGFLGNRIRKQMIDLCRKLIQNTLSHCKNNVMEYLAPSRPDAKSKLCPQCQKDFLSFAFLRSALPAG